MKRYVEDWKANDIIAGVESGQIGLDTEYQREIIWSAEKKSLLIDSILNNVDIPKIYFAKFTEDDRYECIDGKQRIASIQLFYNNKLRSTSGEFLNKLENKKLFLDYKFSVSIVVDPTDEDISTLFHRLNLGIPLNGGELLHAMRGDMRDFIFETVGHNGHFVGKIGLKEYRFSRETALAQMVINSLYFRESKDSFVRARYEDLREFLVHNKEFNVESSRKVGKIEENLKKIEEVFGEDNSKLNRKAAIVSAYLFCEELIKDEKNDELKEFPKFYLKLLYEMKVQADFIKNYQEPTKKILLEKFQKNLQQASAEGYSLYRRHIFIEKAFDHYLKTGKIMGDSQMVLTKDPNIKNFSK